MIRTVDHTSKSVAFLKLPTVVACPLPPLLAGATQSLEDSEYNMEYE